MTDSTTKNNRIFLNSLFVLFFWIAVWQIVYWVVQRDIYVPSPFSVLVRLSELVFLAEFWRSVLLSLMRVFIGLTLSILLGIIMGLISSAYKYVYQLINPLMIAIKATPVMSFIIIALIWFSSSNVPIFICFLMCFPIIWTNVVEGMNNVDKKLLEMARAYKVKKTVIYRKIYLPSVMPYFSAAFITCLGLGWKVSVAAEVLSHPRYGIGSHLYSAKVYLDSSDLFAWTLVVILLSFLFEIVFSRFIRKKQKEKQAVVNSH